MDILLAFMELGDWAAACSKAVPQRKKDEGKEEGRGGKRQKLEGGGHAEARRSAFHSSGFATRFCVLIGCCLLPMGQRRTLADASVPVTSGSCRPVGMAELWQGRRRPRRAAAARGRTQAPAARIRT